MFTFPRILAILSVCALAASPFLPWLELSVRGGPVTLKEFASHLTSSEILRVNIWPLPIILAVLFLLPLLTNLKLTRSLYYLLLLEIIVVTAIYLYPSVRGILAEAGIYVNLSLVRSGAYVFVGALLLLFISALATLWQSRLGIAALTLFVAFTALIALGNLTAWFGFVTGEPRIWHESYGARVAEGQAYGVHLNILNEGWGKLNLNAAPSEKPRETDMIIAIQRHYRMGDYWADSPFDRLATDPSKERLPAEITPGDSLMLDFVFGPLTKVQDIYSYPPTGMSGRYRILLTEAGGGREYRHEIEVPPAFPTEAP